MNLRHLTSLTALHNSQCAFAKTVALTWFQFSGVVEYMDEGGSAEKHAWTFKSYLVPHRIFLQS